MLSSREPPYDEALNWLKFSYMGDRLGAHVALSLTGLKFITLTDREPLFAPALQRLHKLYPRAYARARFGPLGPDYELVMEQKPWLDMELEAGTRIDLSPLVDEPYPGWEMEEEMHVDLFHIGDDPYPGLAHE